MCPHILTHVTAHGDCMDIVRESALKLKSWRKLQQQKRIQRESLLGLGLLMLLDVDAEEAILQSMDEDDVMDVLLSGFLHGR